MKKALASIAVVLAIVLCGCATAQNEAANDNTDTTTSAVEATNAQETITYHYATASEGKELLLSNTAYYEGFSQNDLDFRMQKTGATMEEYQAFVADQIQEFTDEEKAFIDGYFKKMNNTLVQNGYTLPELDEIVLVKTTALEECEASGYTHGTTLYLCDLSLEYFMDGNEPEVFTEILWHELFHCLTRRYPDFRASMYELIHFTMHDAEYTLPPSVMEYHISNPDVEHHGSSAVFSIDGKDVECFCDYVTTQHFQEEGDNFFDYGTTALIPVDGTDTYYTPEQAANFNEVFGENTDYVIDPEECMADNFSFALIYGMEGKDGNGYKSPEIIEGILALLS